MLRPQPIWFHPHNTVQRNNERRIFDKFELPRSVAMLKAYGDAGIPKGFNFSINLDPLKRELQLKIWHPVVEIQADLNISEYVFYETPFVEDMLAACCRRIENEVCQQAVKGDVFNDLNTLRRMYESACDEQMSQESMRRHFQERAEKAEATITRQNKRKREAAKRKREQLKAERKRGRR